MKSITNRILSVLLIFACTGSARAQNTDAAALVKQGIQLHDQGKYPEAIEKYQQALKAEPTNMQAEFEMSYSLFSSGRGTEAIPHLEKVLKGNDPGLTAGAYDMLGSIYDDNKQPEKAIELYQQGVKADPKYQRLRYNLAICYFRANKYPEAEQEAMTAIKLDPKHASSQRVYALAAYKLNKRAASLLAWCSFIMLEPQTQRSAEAMAYIKNIVNFGISKTDDKHTNINISPNEPANMMMPIATIAATEGKKGLTAVDSLQLQLTSLFQVAHTVTDDKNQPFLTNFYSGYFETLAKSGNMPAFTRYIILSVNKDDSINWFKEHPTEAAAFTNWLKDTKREF